MRWGEDAVDQDTFNSLVINLSRFTEDEINKDPVAANEKARFCKTRTSKWNGGLFDVQGEPTKYITSWQIPILSTTAYLFLQKTPKSTWVIL